MSQGNWFFAVHVTEEWKDNPALDRSHVEFKTIENGSIDFVLAFNLIAMDWTCHTSGNLCWTKSDWLVPGVKIDLASHRKCFPSDYNFEDIYCVAVCWSHVRLQTVSNEIVRYVGRFPKIMTSWNCEIIMHSCPSEVRTPVDFGPKHVLRPRRTLWPYFSL